MISPRSHLLDFSIETMYKVQETRTGWVGYFLMYCMEYRVDNRETAIWPLWTTTLFVLEKTPVQHMYARNKQHANCQQK